MKVARVAKAVQVQLIHFDYVIARVSTIKPWGFCETSRKESSQIYKYFVHVVFLKFKNCGKIHIQFIILGFFFFFFFYCSVWHAVYWFTNQVLNPCRLQWKYRVLTTGSQAKSLILTIFSVQFSSIKFIYGLCVCVCVCVCNHHHHSSL